MCSTFFEFMILPTFYKFTTQKKKLSRKLPMNLTLLKCNTLGSRLKVPPNILYCRAYSGFIDYRVIEIVFTTKNTVKLGTVDKSTIQF